MWYAWTLYYLNELRDLNDRSLVCINKKLQSAAEVASAEQVCGPSADGCQNPA